MRGQFQPARGLGERLHPLTNPSPEYIPSLASFCRVRNYVCRTATLREPTQRIMQPVVGESVAFGCDQHKFTPQSAKEVQKLLIARLRGNVDIDQGH